MHVCKNYIVLFVLTVSLSSIKAAGSCGLNETPGCGSCDITCGGILNDPDCRSRCYDVPCKCLPGFVRDPSGACVPVESCPVIDVEPVCGPNQHYGCKDCIGTCSDKVCAAKESCVSKGCVCDDGFVLNLQTNQCVQPNHCCGGNSTFSECGPIVPETCPSPGTENNVRSKLMEVALNICGPSTCVCNKGYVLNYKQECVKLEDCPKPLVCGENEVEMTSASNCPRTCDNYMDRKFKCADPTRSRKCVCNRGYVLDSTGKCIPPDTCPPKEKLQELQKIIKPASTFVPPANVPSVIVPSVIAPSVEVLAPSVTTSSVTSSSATASSVTAPSVIAPTATAPSVIAPSVTSSSATASSVTAPSVNVPSVIAPPATAPSVIAPSAIAPSAIAPSVNVPSVIAPTAIAPSAIAPSMNVPSMNIPSFNVPSAIAPSSIAPSMNVPSFNMPSFNVPSAIAPSTTSLANMNVPTIPSGNRFILNQYLQQMVSPVSPVFGPYVAPPSMLYWPTPYLGPIFTRNIQRFRQRIPKTYCCNVWPGSFCLPVSCRPTSYIPRGIVRNNYINRFYYTTPLY